MLLKENYKGYEFNEVYIIPFDKENDQDYKLKVCEFNDFKKSFPERYPNLNKIIDQEDCSESKEKEIEKICLSHAMQFLLTSVISLKGRLPFEHKILNKSLEIYLNTPFQIETWRFLAESFPNIINEEKHVNFLDELDSFGLNHKAISEAHQILGKSIVERWKILEKESPTLASLAKALLVLPFLLHQLNQYFQNLELLERVIETN